jgi:hypothetical protein
MQQWNSMNLPKIDLPKEIDPSKLLLVFEAQKTSVSKGITHID